MGSKREEWGGPYNGGLRKAVAKVPRQKKSRVQLGIQTPWHGVDYERGTTPKRQSESICGKRKNQQARGRGEANNWKQSIRCLKEEENMLSFGIAGWGEARRTERSK